VVANCEGGQGPAQAIVLQMMMMTLRTKVEEARINMPQLIQKAVLNEACHAIKIITA
jgi:hypothetical protein